MAAEVRSGVRLGAVIAVAVAAGLVVWLVTRGGGSHTATATTSRTGKQVVPITPAGLSTLAAAVRRPIYWAGRRAGVKYELTQLPDGRVYIRYLRPGMKIGDSRPALTIGTYPVADALGAVQRSAAESGAVRLSAPAGAVAFYNRAHPTNAYLAFPGAAYEVEVFDPNAAEAHRLVQTGKIVPVSAGASPTGARLASTGQLVALARSVGHPVYWAGPKTGVEYEVTKASDGRFFVRYLPPGASAGTRTPALTVASYNVNGAFDVVKGLAEKPDATRVPVTGGGVAFYARSEPTSVYVAFPGSNVQIEVYSPRPGEAKGLVSAGKIVPVH